MAAETTPGKPGLIHNKKVMIAVAVAVLAGVAYYLYKRHQNQATAAVTPAADNSTADPNASLGSAGLSPTSGDASGSGSSSGSDLSGIESLLATEQASNAALNAANGNLYGGVITSQESLIADLAGSVQTVSQTALEQLGSVAGSAVSGLSTAAANQSSKAATPTPQDITPQPAQPTLPADGGGGSSVYNQPLIGGTYTDPLLIRTPQPPPPQTHVNIPPVTRGGTHHGGLQ